MKLDINKIKNSGRRKYAHFDKRVGLKEVYHYIKNSQNIKTHNFYPFIYYEKNMIKYSKEGKKEKIRPICYASHIDRCIFQAYSYILNDLYNKEIKKLDIEKCAIAYRTDIHKCNIHFAKEVFDFIKENEQCFIMVGDFKGFFDNLNHYYLKLQLCKLLSVDKLPDDIYAVYKNMTKYSMWRLEDLLKINGLRNTSFNIQTLNSYETVISLKKFKELKSKYIIKNKENYGIPQGSSLSGIFSNIYMIDFDSKINDIVRKNNGIYRRYSDDFIIIIPRIKNEQIINLKNDVIEVIKNTSGITLESNKSKFFVYDKGNITNITSDMISEVKDDKNFIDYLGFTFDGEKIRFREKTLGKNNYRMRRKVKNIMKRKMISPRGKRITLDKVYEKYSVKGMNNKRGNFMTYVSRAERILKNESEIRKVKENNMKNIALTVNKMKSKYCK